MRAFILFLLLLPLSAVSQIDTCYYCFSDVADLTSNITGAVGTVSYSWVCNNGQNFITDTADVTITADTRCILTAFDQVGCEFQDTVDLLLQPEPYTSIELDSCVLNLVAFDDRPDCVEVLEEFDGTNWNFYSVFTSPFELFGYNGTLRLKLMCECDDYYGDPIIVNCGVQCNDFGASCNFINDTLTLNPEDASIYTIISDTLEWRKVDPATNDTIAGETWQLYTAPLTDCDIKESLDIDWRALDDCAPFASGPITGYSGLGFASATHCDGNTVDFSYINVNFGNTVNNSGILVSSTQSEEGFDNNGPMTFNVSYQSPIGLLSHTGQYNYVGDSNYGSQNCNELTWQVNSTAQDLYYTIEWRRTLVTSECGTNVTTGYCSLGACAGISVSATCDADSIVATAIGCTGTPIYNFYKTGQLIQTGTSNILLNPSDGLHTVEVSCDNCLAQNTVDCVVPCVADIDISLSGSCQLIISSVTGCPSYTTQWYKDGVAISGATASTYNVTQNGNYYVLVTGCDNCNSVTSNTITVNGCQAACNASVTIGVANCVATASVLDCDGTPTYLWSTGATTQSINIPSDGTYSVTVSGCCQSASDSEVVTGCNPNLCANYAVNISPGTNQTVCENVPQSFPLTVGVNGGNGGYSFVWRLNGVQVTTASSYTFNSTGRPAGNYVIEARVTDSEGCFDNDFVSILIQDCTAPCTMSVNISPDNQTICEGESITYTRNVSNGTGALSTQWFVNTGSGYQFKASGGIYTFIPTVGTSSVKVEVTDSEGCFDDDFTSLVTEDVCLCGADDCTTTLSLSVCTLTWGTCPNYVATLEENTGSGWFAVAGNPQGSYVSQATASYRLRWTRAGCSAFTTNVVNTSCTPTCALTVAISPSLTTICEGQGTAFSAIPSGGSGNYSYSWTLDGVFKSSAQDYLVTLPVGVNEVEVTVTDNTNPACTATDTDNITVEDFCICGDDSCNKTLSKSGCVLTWSQCPGFTVTLNYNDGSGYVPVVGATSPYTAEDDGGYQLIYSRSGCISTTSNGVVITGCEPVCALTVGALSADSGCYGESKTFTSSVSNGTAPYTYEWYRNGSLVSNSVNYSTGILNAGTYNIYYTVTDIDGCTDTSNTVTWTVHPGVNLAATLTAASPILGGPCQEVVFTTTQGTSPYSLVWNTGSSSNAVTTVSTEEVAANASKTYTGTVTDANGCTDTDAVTYTQRGATFTLPMSAIDNGDFVFFTSLLVNICDPQGGASFIEYLWSTAQIPSTFLQEFVISNTTGCLDQDLIESYNPSAQLPSIATIESAMQSALSAVTTSCTLTFDGTAVVIQDPSFELYNVEIFSTVYDNQNISICEIVDNEDFTNQNYNVNACCY